MTPTPEKNPIRVDLCVATAGRPEWLRDLLESFAQMNVEGFAPRVVVVDNDATGSAREVVENFTRRGVFEVVYEVEPARGISHARNRALEKVISPFFAFVDDDETVRKDWLAEMFGAMVRFNADVVFGPARENHIGGTPDWMHGQEIQYLLGGGDAPPTGSAVTQGSTNNVLVQTSALGEPLARFDTSFGLTGGGDTEYFYRLHLLGRKMIWCDEAVVDEKTPSERLTRSWLYRRAFRNGQGFARVFVTRLGAWKKLGWYLKKSVHLIVGSAILPLVRLFSRIRFIRLFCKVCATAGQFSVLLGPSAYYEEYGETRYRRALNKN
jgi:succinoglycan biosynthesis protein ExoM